MERSICGARWGRRQLGLASWGRATALSPRSRRSTRGRHLLAILAVAVGFATWTGQALADFPYVGDGTAADPSSWALAPGHVPSNLGGLGWKFAATPAMPPSQQSNPAEYQGITQNNSQQDELCGVTGMSLVDAHASFPSGTGSCIAAGSPVKTAFAVTLGRPDVSIGELDSGIKWNDAGDMTQLRRKVLLNAGELPAPRVDLSKTFDPSTGVDCETAHAGSGGDFNASGGMPGGSPGATG
ncbi:MAG: Subtilase family protein, partial [Solirubrobacterales bacterium]|nr:Subtilase family protein [Solirubrobacterales bacterium]